jgi:hypothetical protein
MVFATDIQSSDCFLVCILSRGTIQGLRFEKCLHRVRFQHIIPFTHCRVRRSRPCWRVQAAGHGGASTVLMPHVLLDE